MKQHLIIVVITIFQSITDAQHWWNFQDILQLQRSPYFTPLPGKRFTHDPKIGEYAWSIDDVEVNIPKAGFGKFVGTSVAVDYDYTWTQWPPIKGRTVNQFLGIPYAAPPVNDERFRVPRPAYLDTRYPYFAKRLKSACLQQPSRFQEFIPGFDDFSEDCLYLNIYYPNRTWEEPTTRYPVVVHIHGGSYIHGSSHFYPGHALASMGVVVVTFNYRLGPLGFLSTGDFASVGNYGLWDQLLALLWVRDNIWWFKGDPNQITVMGESAGGASVGLLLVSPVSRDRGLFHQAIIMSGSDLAQWAVSNPDTIRPVDYVKNMSKALGCRTDDAYAMIYCLRYYTDIDKLMTEASKLIPLPAAPDEIWTPVVDGRVGFLPRMPIEERKQGRFQKLPVLMGVVHDEASKKAYGLLHKWGIKGNLLGDFSIDNLEEAIKAFLKYQNAKRVEETAEELMVRYTWWSNQYNLTARKENFVALLSDFFINSAVDNTLRFQAPHTENAYFYEYAYRGLNDTQPKNFGIYHGVEVPFLFGFPFINKTLWTSFLQPHSIPKNQVWNYPHDTNMSEFTMMLWTNFIRLGDPTPWEIRNVTWLPYHVEEQNYLHIYINSSVRQRYRQSHMAFWRERFEEVAEPEPAAERRYYYPFFDVQIATVVLTFVLIFLLIGIVIVVVLLCKRPSPDDFREDAGVGGDKFVSVFKDTFAGYGIESDV